MQAELAGSRDVRTHIVLVPGFVGFDALGQLAYYAGVTELFVEFRRRQPHAQVSLHYFDNFPTASVKLRARLLQGYLAKRIMRGEFGPRDRVALVGHSTGGLDIRRALHELGQGGVVRVDGSCELPKEAVLARIAHLVFISTPHFGTNIADFWCRFDSTIQSFVKNAGIGVQLNRDPVAWLRRLLMESLPATNTGLLLAIADALQESDEDRVGSDSRRADERSARASFALWLEHIGKDFQVIEDLRSSGVDDLERESPAHFDVAQRRAELALLRAHHITTRSFATRAPARPAGRMTTALLELLKWGGPLVEGISELSNVAAERWWLPFISLPAVVGRAALPAPSLLAAIVLLHEHPEIPYDLFYALCADREGPFKHPGARAPDGIAPTVAPLLAGAPIPSSALTAADNDAVVNTLSMLWPYEEAYPEDHPVTLVEGDHGDVIGHYQHRLHHDPSGSGRRYFAYDIFPSGSGFDEARFGEVWRQVFHSCLC